MTPTSLEQAVEQVRAAAPSLAAASDCITGRAYLSIYAVNAKPEEIAVALEEALPGWYGARHNSGENNSWASIDRYNATISVFVTEMQAKAYIARQKAAA